VSTNINPICYREREKKNPPTKLHPQQSEEEGGKIKANNHHSTPLLPKKNFKHTNLTKNAGAMSPKLNPEVHELRDSNKWTKTKLDGGGIETSGD